MKKINKIGFLLLLIGISLIAINFIGIFIPLRNADIYLEEKVAFKDDIIFSEAQLLKKLRRENESDEIYTVKANEAIFLGIAHYWKDEGIKKYNIRVPIYENYILFFAGYFYPSHFEKYEFNNYKKAIERGVGLCSQHAIILAESLENNGVKTKILDIKDHVVTMVQVNKENDTWWVVDPDFGVVIKNNINEIVQNPKIIQPYYAEKGYDERTINILTDSYSTVDRVCDGALGYSGWKRYYIEKSSYVGIWIIPLLLILTSIILFVKKH